MTAVAARSTGAGIARPSLVFDENAARRALDAIAARGTGKSPAGRGEVVKVLQDLLHAGRQEAERRLTADGKGRQCAVTLSYLQDAIIRQLHGFAERHAGEAGARSASESLSVVAVGGYGRGTLAPGSDIDLLFVLPARQTPSGEQVVEHMLYI
ncbi:MAG: nucleotidyltransferase domain-containing protein, partial [Pseudomonadota bacterium]|nr:nucleotidyltransferase domain-containing protein [Pseudomonadota bacterium]